MQRWSRCLCVVPALLVAMGCAKAKLEDDAADPQPDGGGPSVDAQVDATSCGDLCDDDEDGVVDGSDQCADTPVGEPVNLVGCADAQVSPTLEDTFPPYGLTWAPTGELGRAGGLIWTYTGIARDDRFHIYWVVCDDPATPCGLSLDGALDAAGEHWQFSAIYSDLSAGRLVFTSTTQIVLADASVRPLSSRLTVTIVDASEAAIPFAALATLAVTGRAGTHGAELLGAGFEVVALAEVQDTLTSTWMPYLDYFDAAPTPEVGGPQATTSFGGSFYDE